MTMIQGEPWIRMPFVDVRFVGVKHVKKCKNEFLINV